MTTIKNYEIIEQIGSGGMGTVYLARDPRLQRLVAIKKIRIPSNIQSDTRDELITRFYREARALATLNHPNIVTVYDMGEEESDCYMVMEYLDGKDLDSIIEEKGILPVDEAVSILIQACDALYYIHQKQLIHRDIKPANMIYCTGNILKLMDFGLVRRDDNIHLTRAGTIMGSIAYMAPEQIQDPKNIDYKVDMYAFGITLYQALTKHYPYPGETPFEIITKVTLEDPIPVSKFNPLVPKSLEKIVMKIIAKDKKNRYEDMQEIKNALLNYNKSTETLQKIEPKQNILEKTIITDSVSLLKKYAKSDSGTVIYDSGEHKIKNEFNKEPINPPKNFEVRTNQSPKSVAKPKEEELFSPANLLSQDFSLDKPIEEIKIKPNKSSNTFSGVDNNAFNFQFFNIEKSLDLDLKESLNEKRKEYFDNHKATNIKVPQKILSIIDANKKYVPYKYPKKLSDLTEDEIDLLNEEIEYSLNHIDEIRKTISYIDSLKDDITYELDALNKDIKELSRYNAYAMSEYHNKLENKKHQKNLKEDDLKLLIEKHNLYNSLVKSKELKKKINTEIVNYLISNKTGAFFDDNYDFISLPENLAESLKNIISDKIDKIEFFRGIIDKSNSSLFTLKTQSSNLLDTAVPYAKVIRFLVKNNSLKVKILQDLNNLSLIELDITNFHTIFTYNDMTRDGKYIPRGKKGEEVLIKSDLFNEFVVDDITEDTEIFLSKSRSLNKQLFTQEIRGYDNLQTLLEDMLIIYENDINNSFDNLANMFSELQVNDIEGFEAIKQSINLKTNKIKKALLELKKEFEQSALEIHKEFLKHVNNVILVLNRVPNLIKSVEDGIRQKKEQRKRFFQTITMQLSKTQPEIIRSNLDGLKNSINSANTSIIPPSLIETLNYYLLYKAKLPTKVSKDHIVNILSKDRSKFNAFEIDWLCKVLDLNYAKDIGFYPR